MEMTDKQKIFADEYCIDCNGTRAYKVAYPNVKKDESASVNASKLLRKTNVKTYIDERMKEISSNKIVSMQEALELLSSIARGETKEVVITNSGKQIERPPDNSQRTRAIAEILKRYPVAQELNINHKGVAILNDIRKSD